TTPPPPAAAPSHSATVTTLSDTCPALIIHGGPGAGITRCENIQAPRSSDAAIMIRIKVRFPQRPARQQPAPPVQAPAPLASHARVRQRCCSCSAYRALGNGLPTGPDDGAPSGRADSFSELHSDAIRALKPAPPLTTGVKPRRPRPPLLRRRCWQMPGHSQSFPVFPAERASNSERTQRFRLLGGQLGLARSGIMSARSASFNATLPASGRSAKGRRVPRRGAAPPRPTLVKAALVIVGAGLGATTALAITAETAGQLAAPGGRATFGG